MKSISKLKDEARKYEQREEWEKAIQTYLQVLRAADDDEAEVDLALYNRLGDLCVRLGRPEEAVRHYEQAADRYAEAGLYNNAIALCNKALRYNRDRPELIRKLGQFSASQGFITDARRYFLDYAERQFNAGRVDDALSALEDFANVADDAEVREMLGRRLQAHGRTADAIRELQRAYAMRVRDGDTERAEALLAELQGMDAAAAAEAEVSPRTPTPTARAAHDLPGFEPEPDVEVADFADPGAAPVEGFEPGELERSVEMESVPMDGLEPSATPTDIDIDTSSIEGLESGAVDFSAVESQADDIGIIRGETSYGDALIPEPDASSGESFDLPLLDDEPPPRRVSELPLLDDEPPPGPASDLPLLDDEPEATPAPDPRLDDFALIDLGTDFSFDLGGFGTMEPAVESQPAEDVPLQAGGADDDGISLPDVEGDFDFDEAPVAEQRVSDPVEAPGDDGIQIGTEDDDAFELPLLSDPTEDVASTEPTFDGASELDTEPPPWEPEPPPTFDVPVFEAEPSGYDDVASELEDEDGEIVVDDPSDGTSTDFAADPAAVTDDDLDGPAAAEPPAYNIPVFAEPDETLDLPRRADAETADLPELVEIDDEESQSGPLPLLEEPAPPRDQVTARPGGLARPRGEIPAIELPTWDTEPPPPQETEMAPGADEWLSHLDASPADAADAAFRDDTDRDWLDDVAEDASAAEEATEPEPLAAAEDTATPEPLSAKAPREPAAAARPAADDGFIDLGALIAEDDTQASTRFRIQETAPTGDEDRDFAELLNQFKSKVHEHLPPEDASAHYDLGLAFKEMGLIDEAIGEFQVALRAGHMRLRVCEELGHCFLMKEQYNIAEKVLSRALGMKFDDELELLGVYYHLGRAYEGLGRKDAARDAYERVLGMDINFEDVTARLSRL